MLDFVFNPLVFYPAPPGRICCTAAYTMPSPFACSCTLEGDSDKSASSREDYSIVTIQVMQAFTLQCSDIYNIGQFSMHEFPSLLDRKPFNVTNQSQFVSVWTACSSCHVLDVNLKRSRNMELWFARGHNAAHLGDTLNQFCNTICNQLVASSL